MKFQYVISLFLILCLTRLPYAQAFVLNNVGPSSAERGSTLLVTLGGEGLDTVTDIDFGPDITMNGIEYVEPTIMDVNITIGDNAELGLRDVTVTGSLGSSTLSPGFEVLYGTLNIFSVDPNSGYRGETMTVTITGQNFDELLEDNLSFGEGIVVSNMISVSPTTMVVEIIISENATLGYRDFSITRNPSNSPVVLENAFLVEIAIPNIIGIMPNAATRGSTLVVHVSGEKMDDVIDIDFGTDITVNSMEILDFYGIDVNITIGDNAQLGFRDVIVTGTLGSSTLSPGFEVLYGTLNIFSVDPNSGYRGETMTVTITGQNFDELLEDNLSFGEGIVVSNMISVSPTTMVVEIIISENATLGYHDFSITRNLSNPPVVLENAFLVELGPPTLTSIDPTSGSRGETIEVTIYGLNLSNITTVLQVSFGLGITVNNILSTSDEQVVVNISINESTALGDRDVVVAPSNGVARLEDAFSVKVGFAQVNSVSPASAARGSTLDITLFGQNLDDATLNVSFGSDIIVNNIVAASYDQAIINISVEDDATLGIRSIAVSGIYGTYTSSPIFTVGVGLTTLTSIDPTSGSRGETIEVTIYGLNLSNITTVLQVSFGLGITVNNILSTSDEQVVVNISINESTALGDRDVVVAPSNGVARLEDAFSVKVGFAQVNSVSPASAARGSTLDITLFGQNLDDATLNVSFGSDIIVNNIVAASYDQAIINISVEDDATLGIRSIAVSGIYGTYTTPPLFTVELGPLTLTAISPSSGILGDTLDVLVEGLNLDYVTDVNQISFGPDIYIYNVLQISTSQISFTIYIYHNTPIGFRNVEITASNGTAILPDAFLVEAIPNNPPQVTIEENFYVDEGSTIEITATGSDPDNDPLDYNWDLDNDGIFETPGQTVNFSAENIDGPANAIVSVRASDPCGASATASATVEVLNVPPVVGEIFAPIDPVESNTEITATSSFTDEGIFDTHTAEWDWGDGNTSTGVIDESDGSGTVTGNHIYVIPGVYIVTLTVTDDDGGIGQSVYQYIVIFDPTAGFVTGGGWINSPEGAYTLNPTLTGKANFGFVSKYKKGQTIPSGNTQFNFNTANFIFSSTSYQWLVIAGPHAKFKGVGTINGTGDYMFMVTATDGDLINSEDKFRIKITDLNDQVVYDNQLGDDDDAQATQILGGGNISVHSTAASPDLGQGNNEVKLELVPTSFSLKPNYPNPFNPSTIISFDLPEECEVVVRIFNILGEQVGVLVQGRLPAGSYNYTWNSGSLASGLYFYTLDAGNYVEIRKMTLMR